MPKLCCILWVCLCSTLLLAEPNRQAGSGDEQTLTMELLLRELGELQGREVTAADSLALLQIVNSWQQDRMRRDSAQMDSLRWEYLRLEERLHTHVVGLRPITVLSADADGGLIPKKRDYRPKKGPWRYDATIMAQLTQNYVSPNWYQGGSSSFAMLAIAKGNVGYYGKNFTWENTGEWRAGFSTVSGDTVHRVNTTDDLLRLYSKANYKFITNLYGSLSAEFQTSFFPTYKANSMERKSGPFAPVRLNLAVGLDYKPVKGLSISASPLAYKMVHLSDTARIARTDYGVPQGKKTLNGIGSSVRVEYEWKPLREIAVDTKFYLFTNYRQVFELDWEINTNFFINRFLSARLSLHPRYYYDKAVVAETGEKPKLQFRELLSLGFAHKFR